MSAIVELEHDFVELKNLCSQARRLRVQNCLKAEIEKVEAELTSLRMAAKDTGMDVDDAQKLVTVKPKVLTQPITTYARDQSEKFYKLYVPVKDVKNLPEDNVKSEFTETSVRLTVLDLNNRKQELYISPLAEKIDPGNSKHRVRDDEVLLMLKKKIEGRNWPNVTRDSKRETPKVPDVEPNEDPNQSIMKLLKNMYDDGDDDMKRSIAKAWEESQKKNASVDM